jgi:hypothetical protein
VQVKLRSFSRHWPGMNERTVFKRVVLLNADDNISPLSEVCIFSLPASIIKLAHCTSRTLNTAHMVITIVCMHGTLSNDDWNATPNASWFLLMTLFLHFIWGLTTMPFDYRLLARSALKMHDIMLLDMSARAWKLVPAAFLFGKVVASAPHFLFLNLPHLYASCQRGKSPVLTLLLIQDVCPGISTLALHEPSIVQWRMKLQLQTLPEFLWGNYILHFIWGLLLQTNHHAHFVLEHATSACPLIIEMQLQTLSDQTWRHHFSTSSEGLLIPTRLHQTWCCLLRLLCSGLSSKIACIRCWIASIVPCRPI